MSQRFYWTIILIGLLCIFSTSTKAQTQPGAVLTQLQTDRFPIVAFNMDVYNEEGNFIHGIQAANIKIFEDEQSIPVLDFNEHRTGVQFVVAINPGSSFTVRNSQGYSRFDTIIESLVNWGRTRLGSTIDDLSILITDGPQATHISNPLELFYTLVDYDIENVTSLPTLDTLSRAVEIASDPLPRTDMKRAVLFITAPIEGDTTFGIQNAISQALQQQVKIFIWQISLPGGFDSQVSANFVELANQTGGKYFSFSGDEILPNPEIYLEPLRNYYVIRNSSQILTGGSHKIVVEVNHNGQVFQSNAISFDINLQPPNPVFLAPILEVERSAEKTDKITFFNGQPELIPAYQDYQILVDYPDGRSRPIVSATLFADGEKVDENLAPPFDKFRWDISKYLQNGQHVLYVEIEDELGLRGKTIDTPVFIRVELPSKNPFAFLSGNLQIVAGSVALLAGALLLLILIMGGKIQPGPMLSGMSRKRIKGKKVVDPLKLSLEITQEPGLSPTSSISTGLYGASSVEKLSERAYLKLITTDEERGLLTTIPLTEPEIVFGKDPQVNHVINDPSVDERHARLVRTENGGYKIFDEGSIAGTWVNYAPVSRDGVEVRNGDLIHIGRVGYRFIRSDK